MSSDEYLAVVEALTAAPTRHSLSADFRAAAHAMADTLDGFGYAVRVDPVSLPGRETLNVVADKEGTGDDPRELVHVVAHLDSVNTAGGAAAVAPGADDNASGAAGVVEIARVLSATACSHDLRLILFGGEEQGLYGSRHHVAQMPAAERGRTAAVINMDMIARLNEAGSRSVLLEGSAVSEPLMDALAEAASSHTDLGVFTSLEPFGSDHVPFIEAGLPAVLTIEGADQLNIDEHTDRDTVDRLDLGLAVAILRMNVAALAGMLRVVDPVATAPCHADPDLDPDLDLDLDPGPGDGDDAG